MLGVSDRLALRQFVGMLKTSRYAHAAAQHKSAAEASKPVLSRLPNGVLVASCETHSPLSRIAIVARGGPRYETSDLVGASHFVRRVIGIVGTQHFTAFGLTRSIQQMGASVTSWNNREHLFVAVDVIRDYAHDAAERLAEAATKIQFDRHWEIEEALKYVEADQAAYNQHLESRLLDALHDAAYRSSLRRSLFAAPYRTRENLELHEFVEAFHSRAFGAGSNVAVVALGLSHADATSFAAKLKVGSGDAKHAAQPAVKEASKFGGGERRVDTGDDVTHAALAYEAAGYSDLRGSLAFAALAKTIGGAQTVSRASNAATNRLGAALATAGLRAPHFVSSLHLQHSDSALFGFYVQADSHEINKAVRAGRAAFALALKNGVSAEDLQRAKVQLRSEAALSSESHANWIESAGGSVLETGKLPLSFDALSAEIDRITLDEVNAAARRVASAKPAYAAVGGLEHAPTLDEL